MQPSSLENYWVNRDRLSSCAKRRIYPNRRRSFVASLLRMTRMQSTQRSSASRLRLDMPVTYLKGVGPMRAEALRRLGVMTSGDLLFHIPHRYEDASTECGTADRRTS